MNTRDRNRGRLLAAAGAALGLALAGLHTFERADLGFLDLLERRLLPAVPSQVVALEIDPATTADFGWPLPKPVLEAALRALADLGAKRVGLDVLLVDREHRIPVRAAAPTPPDAAEGDGAAAAEEAQLADAARKARAVFASYRVALSNPPSGPLAPTPPEGALRCAQRSPNAFVQPLVGSLRAASVGLIDVEPSVDGTFRTAFACRTLHDGGALSLSSALVDERPACGSCDAPELVPFLRAYDAFPRLSLADLFDALRTPEGSERLRRLVRGRIVVVGITDETLGDFGATPRSPREPLVTLHANRVDALLAGLRIVPVSPLGPTILSLLALGAAAWTVRRTRALLALAAGSLLAGAVVSALAFGTRLLWLAPSPLVLPFFLGALAAALHAGWLKLRFNEMLNQAFSEYVAPEVLEWLRTTGGAALSPASASTREITILFSDISGYTRLSNSLGAGQIMDSLRLYLSAMVGVVKRHGGYVDKINGDGLMVLFGAPGTSGRTADQALACAQEMQAEVSRLQERWRALTGGELVIRIGLATGTVFVGNLGGEGHIEYTAIGRAVNLAARLESKCALQGVLLCEVTYERLAAKPPGALREIELKGYEEAGPVRAWQVPPPR